VKERVLESPVRDDCLDNRYAETPFVRSRLQVPNTHSFSVSAKPGNQICQLTRITVDSLLKCEEFKSWRREVSFKIYLMYFDAIQ
jgi:hypothetical protein